MSDYESKRAQIEQIRSLIGDKAADAALIALNTEHQAAVQQCIEAQNAQIEATLQATASGDVRDNIVIHTLRVAPGGHVQLGTRRPPRPNDDTLQRTLTSYLETAIARSRYLVLPGQATSSHQQLRVELGAVFMNLTTDWRIAAFGQLRNEDMLQGSVILRLAKQPQQSPTLAELLDSDSDLRQWFEELFTPEEQALALAEPQKGHIQQEADMEGWQREQMLQQQHEHQRQFLLARLLQPRTALELLRHERTLVILGHPGSGKTTILRHLMLGFAHARLSAGRSDAPALASELAWDGPLPLPVFVSLRRFAEQLDQAPVNAEPLLSAITGQLSGDQHEALAEDIVERLEAGEVLVMCDGLDEVADETRRRRVVRAIELFQQRFSQSRMVLTSRIHAYQGTYRLGPPFQVATLAPLTAAEQDAFLQRWYQAHMMEQVTHREQHAQQKAHELSQALERRPRLREIGAIPLLLTMIAIVHQRRWRLPQQRAELYRECLLLLLEEWEQQRDEEGRGLAATLGIPDQTDRLALVQPLAYRLHELGREEARSAELQDWLLPRFLDLQADGQAAKKLIERFTGFLEGRGGLLIARDIQDRYAFPHRTFQEYLAARELIYQGLDHARREVLARRHDAPWREVLLLLVGHLVANGQPEEARALARAVLAADPEGTAAHDQSVVLAGQMMEELEAVPGAENRQLRQDVTMALDTLVRAGHLEARERVAAAFLRGRLASPMVPTPDQPEYWCLVEKGPFWFGDDRQKEPLQQLVLPYNYKIARFPVTNQAFRHFVEAGGYQTRRWWTKHGRAFLKPGGHPYDDQSIAITLPRMWNNDDYNAPAQPVVGISWYEAAAYCVWLTAHGRKAGWLNQDDEIRLPTALEWERAARHTDKRRYPWGRNKPTPEHANYEETGIGRPAPVGCFPKGVGACGAEDMAGNVWEWTSTLWEDGSSLSPRKDFTEEETPELRGGAFLWEVEYLCCGARFRCYPFDWSIFRSFRVVLSRAHG